MHLIKTKDESIFINIHSNSETAREVFGKNGNFYNEKSIQVLQIGRVDDNIRNLYIEFIYKDEKK